VKLRIKKLNEIQIISVTAEIL